MVENFHCRFDIIEQLEDNFTLGQIWIWALFLIFFSRKPTSEAEWTKIFFEALKERSDRGLFEKKNFKRCADKKLGFFLE